MNWIETHEDSIFEHQEFYYLWFCNIGCIGPVQFILEDEGVGQFYLYGLPIEGNPLYHMAHDDFPTPVLH